MTPPAWLTNIPETAEKLNAADRAYDKAREAAKSLPLADKIIALRNAKAEKVKAYAAAVEKSDTDERLRRAF